MDKLYCKSICEYLLAKKQESGYTFNVLLNEGNLTQKFSKGDWSLFPCAIISGNYEYDTNDLQNYCLDFSRELPATLCPALTILTDNISDVVEIEKAVTQWFSNKVTLQTEQVYQNSEGLSFDISIDSSVKIDRSNKDFTYQDGKRTLYQTFIKLKSATDVVIFMRDYHPAEIDFDKGVQLKLIKRGKALEELKRQTDTFTAEQTQQICSGYDEIVSLLGIISFDGFGFTELYQVMSDNNCDIKTALAECTKAVTEQTQRAEEEARKAAEEQRKEEERQQAEVNRVKHINEIFSKQGDSVINRYTDGVIADINSRLDLPYPVFVYGGSTFSEWHIRNELNELDYPNILVKDIVNFSFDHQTYRTEDTDGNFIDRPFSTEILPINYGIQIEIHTKSKTQLAEIKQRIKDWYTEPQTTAVTLLSHEGEQFHVGIWYKCDADTNTDNMAKALGLRFTADGIFSDRRTADTTATKDTYSETLHFYEYESVCFANEPNRLDISNNYRLQINLLRQAVFYGECSVKLSEAVKQLDIDYKNLVSGRTSFLGFLNSNEFKTLKNCYDNRMPLDRNLFDSVFKKIVCIYPNLYDKTVQGWSYEQVKADIQKYADLFDQKFVELYTLLGVPTSFPRETTELPYSFVNLRTYANLMKDDPKLSLSEAMKIQEENIRESRKWKAEEQAAQYQQSESFGGYQQGGSSGGHGLLSSLAHRGIENANIRRNAGNVGKRDLIGQAGCAKTYGGDCSTCNIRHGCSRYLY